MLEAVTPASAYTDQSHRLILHGHGFVPRYVVDPAAGLRVGDAAGFSGRIGSGRDWTPLRAFGWRSDGELSAWLDPGLPRGMHTLELIDPRGVRATRPAAFESLGPDLDPPTVEFELPDDELPVTTGQEIAARFVVRDRPPGQLALVGWEARAAELPVETGRCPVEADPTTVVCSFSASVPFWLAETATFELVAVGRDRGAAAIRVEKKLRFTVRGRPIIAEVRPARGGVQGGTDVIIRGVNFVRGTRAYVDEVPLMPNGGVVVDETTISGRIPGARNLEPGRREVVVRAITGHSTLPGAFEYRLPPAIDSITPEMGDPDGGTAVRIRGVGFAEETRIYFGESLAEAVPLPNLKLMGPTEIRGDTPAGKGTTSVWALDRELGWSVLTGGFTWGTP